MVQSPRMLRTETVIGIRKICRIPTKRIDQLSSAASRSRHSDMKSPNVLFPDEERIQSSHSKKEKAMLEICESIDLKTISISVNLLIEETSYVQDWINMASQLFNHLLTIKEQLSPMRLEVE